MTWLWVMGGGAVGTGLRYGLSLIMPAQGVTAFPVGTLAANLLGCLAIGMCATSMVLPSSVSPHVRLGILVGVLGGFTTFSSFGLETIRMATAGHWAAAAGYVLISNIGGLLAVWLGMRLG